MIAALVALLLTVSTATLVVLIKRSRAVHSFVRTGGAKRKQKSQSASAAARTSATAGPLGPRKRKLLLLHQGALVMDLDIVADKEPPPECRDGEGYVLAAIYLIAATAFAIWMG